MEINDVKKCWMVFTVDPDPDSNSLRETFIGKYTDPNVCDQVLRALLAVGISRNKLVCYTCDILPF